MTPKFLQSGALLALLLLLAPLAARADEVTFRGQKIEYGGLQEKVLIGEIFSDYQNFNRWFDLTLQTPKNKGRRVALIL